MGPAPLPPHERSWRHPSELAADERELVRLSEAPASTRTFAMVTGSIGLLAVVALMITVTPGRQRSPVALDSTTIPSVQVAVAQHAVAPVFDSPNPTVPSHTLALVSFRLATPIGDGRQALTTWAGDSATEGTELDVQLTSGPVVTAVVESIDDDLIVLSITASVDGHPVAQGLPAPDEIVTVLVDPPMTVPFADVATIDVAEGTPVLDDDGELVGLCTRRRNNAVGVVDVTGTDGEQSDAAATTDAGSGSSSTPTSSTPASSDPGSTAPGSSGPVTTTSRSNVSVRNAGATNGVP